VPLGEPHDNNACYLFGAAGHAGLFSTAEDLFRAASALALAREGRHPGIDKGLLKECIMTHTAEDGSQRGLGFDIARLAKGRLCGHLGYTGTVLWWSPELDRVIILLGNRVHPTAREPRMPELRNRLISVLFSDIF
jgi:CubicO group peptidase (beta-lactamase class C family)